VRPLPELLARLPRQYFAALLTRVAAAAATGGEPLIDLGRGNPETGPPDHVVQALQHAASLPGAHGYAPFRGLPELKHAIAARYRDVYGVELDPEREVAVIPGTKSALIEFALCAAGSGETILLPDPGYPDYGSAVALAGARAAALPLDRGGRPEWDAADPGAAALYLNYP